MSECLLKVNNLTKCYNNVKVLDGVSFTLWNNTVNELKKEAGKINT